MKTTLSKCPVCDGELTVTRLRCETCDTVIEGRFANVAFAGLTSDQLDFIETFVRCEGKLTRMQDEMALSYPTVRSRLLEVIRALGYEPEKDLTPEIPDGKRPNVYEEFGSGKISAEEAVRLLHGEE